MPAVLLYRYLSRDYNRLGWVKASITTSVHAFLMSNLLVRVFGTITVTIRDPV